MPIKREISNSIVDIHHFKRLAVSSAQSNNMQEIVNQGNNNNNPPLSSSNNPYNNRVIATTTQPANIVTVMSLADSNFDGQYERIKEIGRGGFSTVYQCKHRETGNFYAVKIIDLRPLRLREKFSPLRLRREVDIMRRLRHPNIIQFVDVFETPDQLLVVMEYAPGNELFDVILARKHLSESDSRPIFSQVSRALFYLHSLNIIHRDIKPENVLILKDPDPRTGLPIAKLLDFGLSKNASRSAAKTFVGTPCYLAPEVEYTARGIGGQYGTPADCWSLGAVLYVMLVARFPEFELDTRTGLLRLKLPPALWGTVSEQAKSLILSLMTVDPHARMTMREVLQHPWLGEFRATNEEIEMTLLAETPINTNDFMMEECPDELDPYLAIPPPPPSSSGYSSLSSEEQSYYNHHPNNNNNTNTNTNTSANIVHPQEARGRDMSLDFHRRTSTDTTPSFDEQQQQPQQQQQQAVILRGSRSPPRSDPLPFAPLLNLQRSVASCFDEAHAYFLDVPEVAVHVRRGAVLCREQLAESTKMLRKVEQTAASVLNLFPDLELAVEEGEPALATEFFNVVRSWVTELRELVGTTQKANRASMIEIQAVVEQSANNLNMYSESNLAATMQLSEAVDASRELFHSIQRLMATTESTDGESHALTQSQLLELFVNLFGQLQRGKLSTNLVEAEGVGGGGSESNSFDSELEGGTGSRSGGGRARLPVVTRLDSDSSTDNSLPPPPPPSTNASFSAIDSFESGVVQQQQQQQSMETDPDPQPLALHHNSTTSSTSSSSSNNSFSNPGKITEEIFSAPLMTSPNIDFSKATAAPTLPLPLLAPPPPSSTSTTSRPPSTISGPLTAQSQARARLLEALHKLRQVDLILEQLGVFWANTEVVLDVLTKKGQHAEQFIGFAHKPKLMARFRERMSEYRKFWYGVREMCQKYLSGVREQPSQRLYGFLDGVTSSATTATNNNMNHSFTNKNNNNVDIDANSFHDSELLPVVRNMMS